jgi:CYTH domain-containing protein
MPLEIERKFLVDTRKWNPTVEGTRLVQAYLSIEPNPTVRVRIAGEKAYLTIKGRTKTISRPEFEYEIPVNDALEMMKLAISNPVEKIRYEIMHEGFLWEVDVFSEKNEGLVIAELELESEDQLFPQPGWLLTEVSGDRRYYNSYLSEHPFREWTDQDGLIFEMPDNKLK